MSVRKRLQLKICGQVQAVNFRYYTVQKAQSLGLTGFVRNLPDGAVEVVAEGEEESLQKLFRWCRVGPLLAQIESVEIEWGKPIGEFERFEIQSLSV